MKPKPKLKWNKEIIPQHTEMVFKCVVSGLVSPFPGKVQQRDLIIKMWPVFITSQDNQNEKITKWTFSIENKVSRHLYKTQEDTEAKINSILSMDREFTFQ